MSHTGNRQAVAPPRRLRAVLFAIYVVVCLLALTWPGYSRFGNSMEPWVLGLPFSLAWVVGWVVLTFVALIVFHLTRGSGEGG
jgi:TRAP-type C4-dicarboxylate transport system permease small subunit